MLGGSFVFAKQTHAEMNLFYVFLNTGHVRLCMRLFSQDMITDHLVEPYEDSLDELAKHFQE